MNTLEISMAEASFASATVLRSFFSGISTEILPASKRRTYSVPSSDSSLLR